MERLKLWDASERLSFSYYDEDRFPLKDVKGRLNNETYKPFAFIITAATNSEWFPSAKQKWEPGLGQSVAWLCCLTARMRTLLAKQLA